MSFANIIASQQKQLESQGGGDNPKVVYPISKHKKLFYEKGQNEVVVQVLPSPDLYSEFYVQKRTIFLNAKTKNGKEINSSFTLDAVENLGSLLEQKIAEWTEKKMLTTPYGSQQKPKTVFNVNVVSVIPNPQAPGQFMQERDQEGNLVVRVFEMPQSAFKEYIKALQNPMINSSGTELSFMDINRPNPVGITKPAKGEMSYKVNIYSALTLPPLGQGWESQLEDLQAHAVPTERLENGYQWVEAFCNIKDGVISGQGQAPAPAQPVMQQPVHNPYAQQVPQQPVHNPYAQQGAQVPPQNTYVAPPVRSQYDYPNQPHTTVAQQPTYQQSPLTTVATPMTPPINIQLPTGMDEPQLDDIGVSTDLSQNNGLGAPVTTAPPVQPVTPTPPPVAPVVPTPPSVGSAPDLSGLSKTPGGMADIDALLKQELNS